MYLWGQLCYTALITKESEEIMPYHTGHGKKKKNKKGKKPKMGKKKR